MIILGFLALFIGEEVLGPTPITWAKLSALEWTLFILLFTAMGSLLAAFFRPSFGGWMAILATIAWLAVEIFGDPGYRFNTRVARTLSIIILNSLLFVWSSMRSMKHA